MSWLKTRRGLQEQIRALQEHEERLKTRNSEQRFEIGRLQQEIEGLKKTVKLYNDASVADQVSRRGMLEEAARLRATIFALCDLAEKARRVAEGEEDSI